MSESCIQHQKTWEEIDYQYDKNVSDIFFEKLCKSNVLYISSLRQFRKNIVVFVLVLDKLSLYED